MSCGILELSRIEEDPHKVLYALASYLYHPSRGTPAAFVTWSGLKDGNAKKFYEYIKSLSYYSVESRYVENPKTANDIALFYWIIPHKDLKEWYRIERVKKVQAV
jgi:hemolysin-activating ACP:hemolysin acyltransferase